MTYQPRIDVLAPEIARIADELRAMCEDDDRLYVDMLTGETDVEGIIRRLYNGLEVEAGIQGALSLQMAERKARHDFSERRSEKLREGMLRILQAVKLDKLALPEVTISVRPVPAKLVVNDPDAVPDDYQTFTPKPNMALIKEGFAPDGDLPNWLRSEPARHTISVRAK